ncbi:MAG: 4-phosphoerythronate dehydrogenase [Candidatus Sumerlaeia bacterium]|nr:4-phosphoerythronate dehydrogenase [Candidatus Sumerlaeia bacterium]
MPLILADENIPQIAEALAAAGEVRLAPGRAINRAMLADVDALAVRSVTKVDPALLSGTPVRVVASATSGMDHVDVSGLRAAGVRVDSAEGSNAWSVVEYVVAALLEIEASFGSTRGARLGVVGLGRIGGKVARVARSLGFDVRACDPPLAEAGHDDGAGGAFLPLGDLIAWADVATLHVPLTNGGRWPTRSMIDTEALSRARRGLHFINASRGEVVVEASLRQALGSGALRSATLDVWQDEPRIDSATLDAAFLATPHIAGYSFDGKLEGTRMVAQAISEALGAPFDWRPTLEPADALPLAWDSGAADWTQLRRLVRGAYDIREDDAALRAAPADGFGAHFDSLRKRYRKRREFTAFVVRGASLPPFLDTLRFRTVPG